MNFVRKIACLIVALGAGLIPLAASAQSQPNSIESILVSQQGGEVLIKVAAAGVNRPDVLQRKGAYAPPPGASDLPGLETFAGNVLHSSQFTSGKDWKGRNAIVIAPSPAGFSTTAKAQSVVFTAYQRLPWRSR